MTNKTYLVTGASRGIGRAIAEKLIEDDNQVIALSRNINWHSPFLVPIQLDLSDIDNLPSRLSSLKNTITKLDGIICCSGRGRFGSLEEFSYAQIQELMNLNFLSHVYLIKAFLPMFKQKNEGSLVMIGSEASLAGKKKGSIYCASKFALRGFCQALREECASSSIRVTLINPGMVKTAFFDQLDFMPGPSSLEHIFPEDVADVTLHVLSARLGTVFDEINLSPQKKKIIFK